MFDTAHRCALAATVSIHALLAAWWWTTLEPRDAGRADGALQVVWIEAPPAQPPAIPPQAAAPATPMPVPPERRPTPPAERASRARHAPAAAPSTTGDPRPLSAIFLEQASALARSGARHDFRRNPLTDRRAAIEPPPPERIRMREPMTPAVIAARLGELFGGPGYEADPCPRIVRNLARLRTAGADSKPLQEELWRHRRFCQG